MRSLNIFKLTLLWCFMGVCALILLRALNPISSSPKAWQSQPNNGRVGIWEPNDKLKDVVLGKHTFPKHDTVIVDSQGQRYLGMHNGRIVRWYHGGELEDYTQIMGRPAGMSIDKNNNLYVVEELSGELWRVLPNKNVVKLPSKHHGSLKYLNDVVAADDGRVFATRSSTRWPLQDTTRAFLEHNNDGAVFVWEGSNEPYELAKGLAFPNGIVMSHDKKSILVTETTEYRISRIWLTGKRKGKKEVVIDNLPGFPSDIALASDGKSYWATFFDYRTSVPMVDKTAKLPWLRQLLLNIPSNWFPQKKGTPAVFLFDDSGNIKQTFQAPDNSDLPGFSSVVQSKNNLVLTTARPLSHNKTKETSIFLLDISPYMPMNTNVIASK